MRNILFGLALLLCLAGGNTFANSLSIGPFDQGVYSGTQPFNTTGICTNPGDDCSNNDTRVRTADLIQYAWSITSSGIPSGNPDFESVVLEQTIYPGSGAQVQIDTIPTICLAPPAGPGGVNPLSTLTENLDGSTTLVCNLGAMGNGEQKSFSVPVRPEATSVDASTFTTTQFVYALDAAGDKIVPDQDFIDSTIYEVSAAPAFDLIATRREMYQSYTTDMDLGTGNGSEPGYVLYFTAHVAADQLMAGKGIEALSNSATFRPDITVTGSDGVTEIADFPYQIFECIPNPSAWGGTVFGAENLLSSQPISKKVVDSGSCSYSGDHLSGYTMTLNDMNSEGLRYPTESADGTSLAAGPYFVGSYRLRVWVPFSAIDAADGDTSNNTGAVQLTNCLSDFDPDSATGNSNYASGFEPGYNGTAMPDGSASNNCTGPLTLQISARGSFSHRHVSTATDSGGFSHGPLITSYNSGDGIVEPTMNFAAFENYSNSGSLPLNNAEACMMYDNTVAQMVDASAVGASSGKYAYIGNASTAGFDYTEWKVEYGTAAFPGDDPLDGDADGVVDFNPVSGRYDGEWSAMRAMRCDDPVIANWNTDPTLIGIDNINVIRVSAIDPSVTTFDPGENMRLFLPLEMRNSFNGGPHDAMLIPAGTVIASMSTARSDEYWPTWRNILYQPAPESTHGDGDRVTFTRITVDVAKSTLVPLATPGVTGSVLAGNDVIWQLQPVVTSQLQSGGSAENLSIVDILPDGVSYDPTCTVALNDGSPPDLVEYGTPVTGETRLTWYLGNVHSTDTLSPLLFCSSTDPLSPTGAVKINSAYAIADNSGGTTVRSQGIALGQAGAIQASVSVDSVLDSVDDDQIFALNWFNFSTTGTVAAPRVINVLPFNGDGSGGAARAPESDFAGALSLTDEPLMTFSDGSVPAGGEPLIGTLSYSSDSASTINHDPNVNVSNWCEFDGSNFVNPTIAGGGCPSAWTDVTAIQHVSNYDLEPDGNARQGIIMTYTLDTTGNIPGGLYTNTFGVDSASLPDDQFIQAQRESVLIASFSIGDFAFIDMNADGKYASGIDFPVLDGTPIELRRSADDSLVASSTTSDGTFLFDLLGAGDYYVQIPSSVFTNNAPYTAWVAAASNQAANDDVNEETDHSAFSILDPASDGIRTDTVTLSATPPANPGAAPSGEEPIGDNTFNLNDANTNDDFSNLTVDLGLIPGDADADGIPDLLEFGSTNLGALVDTDDDGVLDFLDTDSDNDGISDSYEAGTNPTSPLDTDGDGTPDHLDLDSDADGTPDTIEAGSNPSVPADTDGDGTDDYVDLDSDNDGIADQTEAPNSGIDSDNDGIDDDYDVDETGGLDLNNDGIDDAKTTLDTDGDGHADFRDLDSDNDGIYDIEEAGGTDIEHNGLVDDFVDVNGDGMHDALGAAGIADTLDTDGDGIHDRNDVDSDNDGVPDVLEGTADTDGDSIADYLDIDSDNDGIPDSAEAGIANVDSDGDGIDDKFDVDVTGGNDANDDNIDDDVLTAGLTDTDADNIPDIHDLDSDNDGLTDTIEAGGVDADGNGIVDDLKDLNQDGIDDAMLATPLPLVDNDRDGAANFRDVDSDNDGINDTVEADGSDIDNDGMVDGFIDENDDGLDDTIFLAPLTPPDSDNDGQIDVIDSDSDGDGIPDAMEGVADLDGDGLPNFLDIDSDGDGIGDTEEAGSSPDSPVDSDGDGAVDYLDLDSDNDGVLDSIELAIDTDGDNIADYLDLDSDGDNISDISESGSGDVNGDGMIDSFIDTDNDGQDDKIAATPVSEPDTDDDLAVNRLDVDSDGDGIPDATERNQDVDADGIPDYVDTDVSGNPETQPQPQSGPAPSPDTDSDNDGIADVIEGQIDTDGDGLVDSLDIDSDNDGLPDSVEGNHDSDDDGVIDRLDLDSDNDGLLDSVEAGGNPLNPVDSDNDGYADYLDHDSDNDGLSDTAETQGAIADSNTDGIIDSFVDQDGNGLDDSVQAFPVVTDDTDLDGLPDYLDIDTDNDGILDLIEAGGQDRDGDGIVDAMLDSDGDGIPDVVDVDQTFGADADADGIDDLADFDYILNAVDTDGDGIADRADADPDGDGFVNIRDDGVSNTDWPDADLNGIPDVKEIPLAQANSSSVIRTGLAGGSCSIAYGANTRHGVVMPALMLMCLFGLLIRRSRRIRTKDIYKMLR